VRVGAVLLALVISVHGGQNEPVLDLATERVTFSEALRTFRSGDDSALPSLEASAERMAKLKREDARDVVAFYRALTPDERRAGLEAERRYEALFVEVHEAEGANPAVWRPRRDEIVSELEALISNNRDSADPTPAARALSLAALLEEQRARQDDKLASEQRAAHLSRSEARAREALTIFKRAGMITPTLEPLWLLARAEEARGRVVAAREGFEDCLDLAERVADADFHSRSLRGLLCIAEDEGDRHEQRDLLRELASINEPSKDWWLARRWATYLLAGDETDATLAFLNANAPSRPAERSQWHFLYGSALQRKGDVTEAERHFREVRLRPTISGTSEFSCAEVRGQVWKAQAALERGDAAAALELALPLTDSNCAALVRSQRSYTIGAAYLRLEQFALAESALRGALEQGGAIESRLERTHGESVFGEIVGLETVALLANALAQQGRSFEAVRVAEEAQTRTLRAFEGVAIADDDLRAWSAGFERGLLTWIVGADTMVCAHVGTDGTALAVTVPLGREALHHAVRRVREAAITGDEARACLLAAEIEGRVVPPALRERVAGTGRLLVLAHGPLERMPFDLMPLGEAGALAVLPGLAEARPGGALPADSLNNWSVFGDPSSANGDSVLPGARAEVEALGKLLGTPVRTHDEFDRLALLDALKSGRPLHIATHLIRGCGSDVSSGEAGLLLARGGLLCSREIREVAPRLPLAVLAVCESGEGSFVDAQALSSVSNAFLGSGTRNLCVTLWPIEDSAARRWSEAFHRSLAEGAKPSEASLAARETLRRDGTPVSEWAAFRFAGRD